MKGFTICFISWQTVSITSSAIGLRICEITAAIKRYKSIIKKGKKALSYSVISKTKINTIEILLPKALSESYINHDEFVSVNNVLR